MSKSADSREGILYFILISWTWITGIVVSIRESSASLSQWHTHRTQKSNSSLIGADPTSNRPSPRKFTNLLQLALSLAPFCHCVPTWTPICNRFYLIEGLIIKIIADTDKVTYWPLRTFYWKYKYYGKRSAIILYTSIYKRKIVCSKTVFCIGHVIHMLASR